LFTASRGGLFVVTLTGEIDLMVEPALLSLVEQFRDGRSAVATVDLRRVTFMGSTGLTLLSQLRDVALERGGSVTVLGASGARLRTLALVGFDATFALVP
jgi:anti-anti-sigma factor